MREVSSKYIYETKTKISKFFVKKEINSFCIPNNNTLIPNLLVIVNYYFKKHKKLIDYQRRRQINLDPKSTLIKMEF
jgi:hypothetical protein